MKNINRNKVLSKGFTNGKGLTNGKGFTIVELVIVIAVIGILAAVLIPTFNSIINKANESKATQEVTNAMKEYSTLNYNMNLDEIVITYSDDEEITYIFGYTNGELYIIEYSYLLDNNELYVIDNKYVNVDTSKLKNFPDHMKIYKQDLSYIKYSVKVLNEDYTEYISKSNKEALEKKYLPGEKVIINPIPINDGGLIIKINGENVIDLNYYDNPFNYEFIMPSYDVEIEFTKYVSGTIQPGIHEEISFEQIYPFMDSIDPNEVTEIYYISNQILYNLSNDYSRCIYITNDTEAGKTSINEIINSLKTTTYSYDSNDEYIPEEMGLPREKYVILTEDKTCEFYYEEYVTYNGKYYKNNNYKNLFDENAQEGYSFIRNDMIVTEYLTSVYYDGKESLSYIDLRRIIFIEYEFDEPAVANKFDESVQTTFKARYGSEGDIDTFKIEESKVFSHMVNRYYVVSDYTFDDVKKTYTITLRQDGYDSKYIKYSENQEITYDKLLKFISIDDTVDIDRFIFTYRRDTRENIFKDGNIKINSNKVILYLFDNNSIILTDIYPELKEIEVEDVKNIYLTSSDSVINNTMFSTCTYITNDDSSNEFINKFINSLKNDIYSLGSKASARTWIDVPGEKYVITTETKAYSFYYSTGARFDDQSYIKDTAIVEMPSDLCKTGYTLFKNDIIEEDCIIPVYKNGVETGKTIDIRNMIFMETESVTSKYVESYFTLRNATCIMMDDYTLKCNISKDRYYRIINDFTFENYFDEVQIKITQEIIAGITQPRILDKVITVKRDEVISKQELINEVEINNRKETEKYYIEFTNCYQEQDKETFSENTTITAAAYFGYNLYIQDEELEFVSLKTIQTYNGIRREGEYITLPLNDIKAGYVGVKINDKLVEILAPNSKSNTAYTILPSDYLRKISFTMNEDITVSFERKDSIYDFYPQEIYYKDLYPFITEIEVDDLVEIIYIDKTNTTDLFYEASFITVNENNTESMNYAYEFLRFFKEEKCTLVTEKINNISDGKYIIKTTNGTYEIDDYTLFMINNMRYYESKPLTPFPNTIKVDGYTFKEDTFYITSEVPYERINPEEIVFKKLPNTNTIIVSTEVKLICGVQEVLIPNAKNLVYNNGFERVSLEIINSYSFESYLPCINMLFEYTLYNETISEETKVCTLVFKNGDAITKTKFLSLLSDYGYNEETIFSYANIVSEGSTILFSEFDLEFVYESRDVICYNTNQTIN